MSEPEARLFFADVKSSAVFGTTGPQPQFLLDTPQFKAVVVGLAAGQKIPLHPEGPAMYHFLEGEGFMTVGEEAFPVQPGVTVLAPAGVPRGIQAKTKLILLGARGV